MLVPFAVALVTYVLVYTPAAGKLRAVASDLLSQVCVPSLCLRFAAACKAGCTRIAPLLLWCLGLTVSVVDLQGPKPAPLLAALALLLAACFYGAESLVRPGTQPRDFVLASLITAFTMVLTLTKACLDVGRCLEKGLSR